MIDSTNSPHMFPVGGEHLPGRLPGPKKCFSRSLQIDVFSDIFLFWIFFVCSLLSSMTDLKHLPRVCTLQNEPEPGNSMLSCEATTKWFAILDCTEAQRTTIRFCFYGSRRYNCNFTQFASLLCSSVCRSRARRNLAISLFRRRNP
jgi:hypothetical protein